MVDERAAQLAASRIYQRLMEKRQAEGEALNWPRPDTPNAKVSRTRIAMIQRIAGCPTNVHWGGMVWSGTASAQISLAPELGSATIRALWKRGLLMCGNEDGTIRLSSKSQAYVNPSRVASEAIRWEAIRELAGALAVEWENYRVRGRASKWTDHDNPTPRSQPTKAQIRAHTRAVYNRKKAEAGHLGLTLCP